MECDDLRLAGEIFLANATSRSLQRLRASSRPDTVATFATPPTTLHPTADAVFVGSRGGAVYRADRRDGAVREQGRVRGDVSALSLAGCFLLVGSSAEFVGLEAARGIAAPLAADASVTAVAAAEQRVVYADYRSSGLYDLPLPPRPDPEARGSARPAPVLPPGSRPPCRGPHRQRAAFRQEQRGPAHGPDPIRERRGRVGAAPGPVAGRARAGRGGL